MIGKVSTGNAHGGDQRDHLPSTVKYTPSEEEQMVFRLKALKLARYLRIPNLVSNYAADIYDAGERGYKRWQDINDHSKVALKMTAAERKKLHHLDKSKKTAKELKIDKRVKKEKAAVNAQFI